MITPKWKGETVVCIASGPSMDMDDIDYIRDKDCRVIAINDNYKIAPFADVLYACDLKWWDWHKGATEFEGERWSQDKNACSKYEGINYIEGRNGNGLSVDPSYIHTGHNSGFQAINLAYHFGVEKVVLLGYDMRIHKNGLTHWFGNHPDNVIGSFQNWVPVFNAIASEGLVNVVNCSRETAIKCFPRMPLCEAL